MCNINAFSEAMKNRAVLLKNAPESELPGHIGMICTSCIVHCSGKVNTSVHERTKGAICIVLLH